MRRCSGVPMRASTVATISDLVARRPRSHRVALHRCQHRAAQPEAVGRECRAISGHDTVGLALVPGVRYHDITIHTTICRDMSSMPRWESAARMAHGGPIIIAHMAWLLPSAVCRRRGGVGGLPIWRDNGIDHDKN
eukprot:COSAG01_NODE_2744_length_7150_cov_5.435116_3_plen_136_part_00